MLCFLSEHTFRTIMEHKKLLKATLVKLTREAATSMSYRFILFWLTLRFTGPVLNLNPDLFRNLDKSNKLVFDFFTKGPHCSYTVYQHLRM